MPAFENPNDLPQRPKVEPLKSRTMTLSELQLETLDLIRKLRFQLRRPAHAEGMSDEEFLEHIVEPLETTIYQDREMLRPAFENDPFDFDDPLPYEHLRDFYISFCGAKYD